jgi:Arc/MetJ family transcription regulator
MTTTMIDLDDEALEKARRYYGTATKKDTVNRALRDAAAKAEERLGALGRHLIESVAEYQLMNDQEKAAFRARAIPETSPPDHPCGTDPTPHSER